MLWLFLTATYTQSSIADLDRGWNLCYTGVKKGNLDRLYGHDQLEDLDELEDFIDEIPELLRKFINSGAKESWEDIMDEDFDYHISVDGKEIGRHGELED